MDDSIPTHTIDSTIDHEGDVPSDKPASWNIEPTREADLTAIFDLYGEHNIGYNEDLHFLTRISLCIEVRSSKWSHRTLNGLKLALAMNKSADHRVKPLQLCVAIVAHDVAMGFLPSELIRKPTKLNAKQQRLMRTHINSAADLIHRMTHFSEAKAMIQAHHERVDGHGYPNQLIDDEICDGAKILAIVDAFTAQGESKIMHGIMEISRHSDSQFSGFWLSHFNQTIRSVYRH